MQVITLNTISEIFEKKELVFTTVTLSAAKDIKLKFFRCVYCGEGIAQYFGDVKKIKPGMEPYGASQVVHRCRGCKMNYNFQSHEGYSEPYSKVTLYSRSANSEFFHCCVCHQPILGYSLQGLRQVGLSGVFGLPLPLTCPTSNCRANYLFTDMVI